MIRSTQDQLRDIREGEDLPFAVTLIDTCLPDYLHDHHHRPGELLLGVPVHGDSTVLAVLSDLDNELRQTYLEDGDRGGFDYAKARAAIAKLHEDNADNLAKVFDSSLPSPPDASRFTDEDGEPDDDAFAEAEREWEMAEPCFAWFLIHWDVPDEDEEGGESPSADS